MSRVKLTFAEIKQAILDVRDDLVPENLLKTLLESAPTSEEEILVRENESNYSQLGKAEQFYCEIIKIDRLSQRLSGMHFKRKFNERVTELLPQLSTVFQACCQIRTSKKLQKILEV